MHTEFMGELLGTMMLIILGDGVVACVLLQQSKGQNSGWIVITAGWAFAVFCGVTVAIAAGSPAAHINPAVTVAFAITSGDYSKIPVYIPAQFIGAFIGGVIVWLAYLPHWEKTPDGGLKLAVFCTAPAIRNVVTVPRHRDHRHLRSHLRGRLNLFQGGRGDRRHRDGVRPRACRLARVRHRTVARRPDRLRHQSGA